MTEFAVDALFSYNEAEQRLFKGPRGKYLKSLNTYIGLVCDVKEKINDAVSFSNIEYSEETKKIKLVELNKNISKYKLLLDELLQDYKSDFINQEDYNCFKEKYLYEINKFNFFICPMKKTTEVKWIKKLRKK